MVKPITFSRFFKAVSKAKDYHQLLAKSLATDRTTINKTADYFFIKCDNKYERIYFNEILYIEGLQNYVAIHTEKGKYITLLNLKGVEENLDPAAFIRVHKSYIVSIAKIEAIVNNEINIQLVRIPISRNYRDEVMDRVVIKKLWKKTGDN
jgi:DNA-binding LytR/AlgR family response regulator